MLSVYMQYTCILCVHYCWQEMAGGDGYQSLPVWKTHFITSLYNLCLRFRLFHAYNSELALQCSLSTSCLCNVRWFLIALSLSPIKHSSLIKQCPCQTESQEHDIKPDAVRFCPDGTCFICTRWSQVGTCSLWNTTVFFNRKHDFLFFTLPLQLE